MPIDAPDNALSAPAGVAAPAFLDVPHLLDRSQPHARGPWLWYAAGAFLLLVMLSSYLSSRSEEMAGAVRLLSSMLMVVVVGVMMLYTWMSVRQQRSEVQRLEAIEELVQLRRWSDAGAMLDELLSHPTRTPQARVQALLFLASVLARYHRFDDAIAVQSHLLDNLRLDDATTYALKLGRTMAMLRADHLFDADRAIAELRRAGQDQERESAGLALVELYRDVKTGHPAEAVELFEARLPVLREQLGIRVSDAYALAARAYDLLDRNGEATRAWERATLLSSPAELARRYPELQPLLEKLAPAETPLTMKDEQ